jgi:hypothetical protein
MADLSRDNLISRSWWIVFPLFALLAVRLAAERACGDPYDLLPGITSTPIYAWPLAAVYVAAHVWLLALYLSLVARTQQLLPSLGVIRTAFDRSVGKVFLMLIAFAVEYAPMPLWRFVGSILRCRS